MLGGGCLIISEALYEAFWETLKFAPLIFLILWFGRGLKKRDIKLPENPLLLVVTALLSPGPTSIYILLLKNMRLSDRQRAAFISAQAASGPVRVLMDIAFFGPAFAAVRLILSIFLGIGLYYLF